MRACVILALVLVSALNAGDILGYVTDFRGVWQDDQYRAPVGRLFVVQSDSRISPKTVAATDFLSIRYYANSDIHRFDCSTPLTCAQPLDILSVRENRPPPATSAGSFFSVIRDLVSGSPERLSAYAHLISRGEAVLEDEVAELQDSGFELADAFHRLKNAVYQVELCPVSDKGNPRCPKLPAAISVDVTQGRARIEASGTKPGLHMLYLCHTIGNRVFRGESALVLLVPLSQYSRVRSQFAEARNSVVQWPREESIPHLRLFLLGIGKPYAE